MESNLNLMLILSDPVGCIFTQNLLVPDATEEEIQAVSWTRVEAPLFYKRFIKAISENGSASNSDSVTKDSSKNSAQNVSGNATCPPAATVTVTVGSGSSAPTATASPSNGNGNGNDTSNSNSNSNGNDNNSQGPSGGDNSGKFGKCTNPSVQFGKNTLGFVLRI